MRQGEDVVLMSLQEFSGWGAVGRVVIVTEMGSRPNLTVAEPGLHLRACSIRCVFFRNQ